MYAHIFASKKVEYMHMEEHIYPPRKIYIFLNLNLKMGEGEFSRVKEFLEENV
jgi:hypothetical protein